jgi:RHS repeat-associated protein
VVNNPTYDLDGNMTDTGAGAQYAWDAENRLIRVTKPDGTEVRYTYDGESRRIMREVYKNSTLQSATRYLYDGWNVIAEFDALFSGLRPLFSYTWGLDLSGSLQDAGGVGGLLSKTDHTSTLNLIYTYDGNGNVSELIGMDNSITAHYEYDTFGKMAYSTGSQAALNTYRFSTKPLDAESGLYYYGYRFYDPSLGHWPNRDPIGEQGGKNLLYRFVRNRPVNAIDARGLLEFNIGIGIGGGGTAFGPIIGTTPSIGFSISYSVFLAFGVNTKKATDKVQCAICYTSAFTVMAGGGVAINVGVGPMLTFGPNGDLNSLSGYSVQVGLGIGGPELYPPLSYEVTVDVNLKTKQVTMVIPKLSYGPTLYLAVRVSGSCTGCSGILSPSVAETRMIDCWHNVVDVVRDAFSRLNKVTPSEQTSQTIKYEYSGPLSLDEAK